MHRKLLDNPIVCKDSDHFAIWVYLLLNATHTEYNALFKGEKITLKPGQLLTGRKSISAKLNISESKVRRVLTLFESDQQIDRQRSNQNSLITIVKWCEYQQPDQQDGQQVTTNKKVKNIKTNTMCEIADKSADNITDEIFEKLWELYKNKRGKGQVSMAKKKTLAHIGLEEMTRAINRYKKDLANEPWRKPQNGSTFFNSGYVDYLDANYEDKPTQIQTARPVQASEIPEGWIL